MRIAIISFMCLTVIALPISGIAEKYGNFDNDMRAYADYTSVVVLPDPMAPETSIEINISGSESGLVLSVTYYDNGVFAGTIDIPSGVIGPGMFTVYFFIDNYLISLPIDNNNIGVVGIPGITNNLPADCDFHESALLSPTCTNMGFIYYECAHNGLVLAHNELFIQTIPAVGHNWSWVNIPPTCTTPGINEATCANSFLGCHETMTGPTMKPLGHDWGPWVVTIPATVTAEGEETCFCAHDSSHIQTRSIPRLVEEFTVRFVDWDGTVLKTETVAFGGSATAPPNPSRAGYTFTRWDRAYNYITSNLLVTALYSVSTTTTIVDTPSPTSSSPSTTGLPGAGVSPGSGSGSGPGSTLPQQQPPVKPTAQPQPVYAGPPVVNEIELDPLPVVQESPRRALINELADAGVPILIIGDLEIPLAAFPGMPAWGFLNIILAIFGIVFAIVTLLRVRAQKIFREGKRSLRRHAWVIPAIGLAAFGMIFFILTEDPRNLMVLLWDQWTIVSAAVFAGVVITTKLALNEEGDEDDSGPDKDKNIFFKSVDNNI